MKKICLEDLKSIFYKETEWVKVHAAEFLVWEGMGQYEREIERIFLKEHETFGSQLYYRIGIWRVLAQASKNEESRVFWSNKIYDVSVSNRNADQVHAIESLAKLKVRTGLDFDQRMLVREPQNDVSPKTLYTLWSIANHDHRHASVIQDFLIESIELAALRQYRTAVKITSYILRHLGGLNPDQWQKLSNKVMKISDLELRGSLVATLGMTAPGKRVLDPKVMHELKRLSDLELTQSHYLAAMAEIGGKEDFQALKDLFDQVRDVNRASYDADAHASAAYSLLKFCNRIF